MRRSLPLLIVGLALSLQATPLQGTKATFSWDIKESATGDAPKGVLYLTIAGKRSRISALHTMPSKMDAADRTRLRVPQAAVEAVRTWWAGGGDLFYVIKSGNKFKVFKSWDGEELDKPEPWKPVAVFSSKGTRLKR
jgi:hypothetical protein